MSKVSVNYLLLLVITADLHFFTSTYLETLKLPRCRLRNMKFVVVNEGLDVLIVFCHEKGP